MPVQRIFEHGATRRGWGVIFVAIGNGGALFLPSTRSGGPNIFTHHSEIFITAHPTP